MEKTSDFIPAISELIQDLNERFRVVFVLCNISHFKNRAMVDMKENSFVATDQVYNLLNPVYFPTSESLLLLKEDSLAQSVVRIVNSGIHWKKEKISIIVCLRKWITIICVVIRMRISTPMD